MKKIIITLIVLALITATVVGVVSWKNHSEQKEMKAYAELATTYFEATKDGNNQLMDIAGIYESFSGGFSFEVACAEAGEQLGLYNGASFEINKAYETFAAAEVKHGGQQKIKDAVSKHYEEYKKFEDNIINKTEQNFDENYGRIYKEWQIPFADAHNELRKILAEYR